MYYKSIIFVVFILILGACSKSKKLTDFVNPFIGTGGHGHTYPGATLPFGMVQLSPDTRIDGSWDGCGGYHFSDSLIYGFSHTHLSGTGVSDYGDFMMMPIQESVSLDNKTFQAEFSHENEMASPGFYSVTLDNGIQVDLTASTRVGFQRYTFPQATKKVIIDLHHRDELIEGSIEVLDDKTLKMKRISHAWAENQHAYGYSVFSEPFTYLFNADSTKILLDFSSADDEILIKTGFSFVSADGAKLNLETEIPHWDFDQQKDEAERIWNEALSKIEIKSSRKDKVVVFYTALYHVMIQPNIAMDVDRKYRGRDNKIHTAENFDYYTVFSLWDTFRATHPLYTIIDRKRSLDFIQTFLAQYQQGGRLPVWEFASNETDCMIGYHSVSVIADAVAKGIDGFDTKLALEAMQKSANWNHLGLPAYIKNGYLNIEDEHESVSKTLEYAYDDWCIAQMAQAIGDDAVYQEYMKRSQAWKNLFDPQTNFMRPRKNGDWIAPFDPREVNNYFTEGNSWQYSFFVPHDVYGLMEQMGGKMVFEAKLDELIKAPTETTGRTQADITGLIGQYAHGNEPSHHIAFLYQYAGRTDKTQRLVKKIMDEFYTSHPDGLIGNEDCGQMSAWFVMNAMGIYQINPGSDYFLINAPYFDNIIVNLENGNKFEINALNLSEKNYFTQKIFLNNEVLKAPLALAYKDMMSGGLMEFHLTNEAVTLGDTMVPPLEETIESILVAPLIKASGRSFVNNLEISLSMPNKQSAKLLYTTDGSNPLESGMVYSQPFIIEKTSVIQCVAVDEKGEKSGISTAQFYKKPNDFSVNLISEYNPQYSAGGFDGLVDGIYGSENWRKGDWQGYQGQDFEAIIDLKKATNIRSVSAGFLQDTRSWILFPAKMEVFISDDGIDFTSVGEVSHSEKADDYTSRTMKLSVDFQKVVKAKYVKVKATNFGKLPSWHLGAGFDAFIFIDEIEVR